MTCHINIIPTTDGNDPPIFAGLVLEMNRYNPLVECQLIRSHLTIERMMFALHQIGVDTYAR